LAALVVCGGYIMTLAEEARLPEDIRDHGHQISDHLVMSLTTASEIDGSCYLNHSCEPNAGFKGQIFLVAMRDIAKGEEATFDYAMVLRGKGARAYKLKCRCQTAACRGRVTDNDWKIPSLQQKYDGYFQWFLQEKIGSLNVGKS
jgi:hypothetical protein